MGVFEDNARQLWENGFSVIPVNGKRAFLPYDKYRDKQCDENTLELWIKKHGDCNIGLVTGPASRVAVIDIDIKNNDELLSKAISLLPNSPVQRFGSKGIGLFVKYENQIGQKIRYNGKEIGELIVNTQIVIPPSIHPDTQKPYKWTSYICLGDDTVDDIFDELPSFSNDDLLIFEKQLESSSIKVDKQFFKETVSRNNRLKEVCGAMFEQGLLPEQMAPKLLAQDIGMHGEKSLFKDEGEFKHMANQPLACAYRFASNIFKTYLNSKSHRKESIIQFDSKKEKMIEDNSEYFQYKMFFEKALKNPKKCKISGACVEVGRDMNPIVNRIEALQSYAKQSGLKKADLSIHLYRYLEGLKPELLFDIPKWNGKDWIKEICSYIKLKDGSTDILEAYFKNWGAGIFRRLEDTDNQNMFLILRGDQGIGKDQLIKNMFKCAKPYFSKFSVQPNREVDTWHQVASNLILHLEEFDQSSKLGVPFLKELITVDEKYYRLPYERASRTHKMYGSFISTANVDNIFKDSTGNRRFAVFDIESIDWNYPKDFGMQVLSQCYALYKSRYEIDPVFQKKMKMKINDMTPDDLENDIMDLWDHRLNNLITRSGKFEFGFHEVEPVLEDLRRTSGWGIKTILSILKRTKRSSKMGGIKIYTVGRRNLSQIQ